MKRHLAALAVLCSWAAAASAQSDLTVYGIIDQGVSKLNGGGSFLGYGLGSPGEWSVRQATSSRLGFRGTEDLGGGLRANFVLEHRFLPDTGGLETGNFWEGSSWVGLSRSGLGELRLGRDYTPAFYPAFAGDPWNYDYNVGGFLFFTLAGNKAGTDYIRAANQVSYRTPAWRGLTAMVAASPREAGAGRNLGFNLVYSSGPASQAGSLQIALGMNDVAGPIDDRLTVLSLAYNFDVIRPSLLLARADNGTADADSWVLGATIPVGLGSLKLGYGVLDDPAGVGAAGVRTKKAGLGYEHYLSKRTSVHADFGLAKGKDLSRTSGIEMGFRHAF